MYTYTLVGGDLDSASLSGLASSSASGRSLFTLGANGIPGQTGNGTFVLNGAAAALLGNFLSDTLLVETTVDLGPSDLAGVKALKEERFGLAVDEAEGLSKASKSFHAKRQNIKCTFRNLLYAIQISN